MSRAGTQKKPGSLVPGYDDQLGSRLRSVIERIGSLVKSGDVAGVSDEQISAWRDGRSKMSFHGATQLCQAAGVSLDWLATGVGQESTPEGSLVVDKEHMAAAIQAVEELENGRNLTFTPNQKAELIFITYESIIAEG